MTSEQVSAFKSVSEWVFSGQSSSSSSNSKSLQIDAFGVEKSLLFELHSHSKCSDGLLSPSELVERAHANGVKVLALTDHDTMMGVPEAVETAHRFGMTIIPGVEISTMLNPRGEDSGPVESVHVLAYYSSLGPSRAEEFEKFLSNIREARFSRAHEMVEKLNELEMPITLEQVLSIAGEGVAPGRVHVARALHKSGHAVSAKKAIELYLFDHGPAYVALHEALAEDAVKFICETGGVAVLAHPWSLKYATLVIRRLKEAGLHGMEVFTKKSSNYFSDLADKFDLLKVGGSDFHGKKDGTELELGSVPLPVLALRDFLNVARPIWCNSVMNAVQTYTEDPSDNLGTIE